MRTVPIDPRLTALAATQLGLVTTAQATTLGLSRSSLQRGLAAGRWSSPARGVYLLPETPISALDLARSAPAQAPGPARWAPSVEARVAVLRPHLAALLSSGPDGHLSHRSAARLLGCDGLDENAVDITSLHGRPRTTWTAHRRPPAPGLLTHGPFRYTDPARTLVDLGEVLGDDHVERALESILRLGLAPYESLVPQAGAPGAAVLRRVLARRPPALPPTGSELETRVWQLLYAAAVPMPVRQFEIWHDGVLLYLLDLCWPELRLYLELLGAQHDDGPASEYDRHRRNRLSAMGWRPLELKWRDLIRRPRACVGGVVSALLAVNVPLAS